MLPINRPSLIFRDPLITLPQLHCVDKDGRLFSAAGQRGEVAHGGKREKEILQDRVISDEVVLNSQP